MLNKLAELETKLKLATEIEKLAAGLPDFIQDKIDAKKEKEEGKEEE